MSQIKVRVDKKAIDRAIRSNSARCVVSQGVAQSIPDATRIESDIQTIRFTKNDKRYVFLTPRTVQQYIVDFDAGLEIKPFEFSLNNPQITATKKGRVPRATIENQVAQGTKNLPVRTGGKTPPRPTGRRSVQRTYGHRGLRVNQIPQSAPD